MPDPTFQDYVQGLQMLGGILALPRSAQYAQQSALAHRKMLEDTGMDPADIKAMYPDAPLQWLSAGPGIGGKILGGVGDVGALLSTIAGQPIGPPRMSVSEVAEASKLRKGFKEQQSLDALAKTETDPVGKALLGTGSMDAYGRYKAAQLRAQGQGPRFGTADLGTRARLHYLETNDPTNSEIPALRQAIKEEEERHPIPPPPEKKLSIAEQARQQEEVRKGEAARMNLTPGSPEWNQHVYHTPLPHQPAGAQEKTPGWFYQKELDTQQKRVAANLQETVNYELATKNAQDAYLAYWYTLHPEKRPKAEPSPSVPPGPPAPSPQTPPPPEKKPPPPEARTETPSSSFAEGPPSSAGQYQGVTPPPAETTSPLPYRPPPDRPPLPEEAKLDPADRALLLKYTLAGLNPAEIASNYPALWRRAGYAGYEDMPRDVFYYRLKAAEDAAAQGGAGQQGPQPPADSPLAQPFDITALTPDGQQEAIRIRDDPKLDPGVKAARLQTLMRTSHR